VVLIDDHNYVTKSSLLFCIFWWPETYLRLACSEVVFAARSTSTEECPLDGFRMSERTSELFPFHSLSLFDCQSVHIPCDSGMCRRSCSTWMSPFVYFSRQKIRHASRSQRLREFVRVLLFVHLLSWDNICVLRHICALLVRNYYLVRSSLLDECPLVGWRMAEAGWAKSN
jgi:hypothetical protein